MTEFQKIATGLLSLSHPEIYTLKRPGNETPPEAAGSSAAVRGFKFAFAALVAGSRAVPLGDNSQVTRELGAYGARLQQRFN